MEEPTGQNPPDLSHIDEINNLDTARMTLRWALERLQNLERAQKEALEKLGIERKFKEKADAEAARLQTVLKLKEQEVADREVYYAKLEEYLSQALGGKLDVAALAKREHEVAELKTFLEERQGRLDKEHALRLETLERRYQTMRAEAEANALTKARQESEALSRQKQNLEAAYLAKLSELNDKETRLKTFERELSERQAKFEKFYAEQKARLDKEIELLNHSLEDQTQFRLASAEKFMNARHEALEDVWRKEKQALFSELQEWRHRSEESLPRLLELERQLGAEQETGKQLRLAWERERVRFDQERSLFQEEQEKLLSAVAQWKKKSSIAMSRILELESSADAAEESARRSAAALAEERKRREKLDDKNEKIYQEKVRTLEADHQRAWGLVKAKEANLAELESALATRFKDLEELIHRQDMDWKDREEWLRRRDQDWHLKLADWQKELEEKARGLEVLKDELLKTIHAYKRKEPERNGEK